MHRFISKCGSNPPKKNGLTIWTWIEPMMIVRSPTNMWIDPLNIPSNFLLHVSTRNPCLVLVPFILGCRYWIYIISISSIHDWKSLKNHISGYWRVCEMENRNVWKRWITINQLYRCGFPPKKGEFTNNKSVFHIVKKMLVDLFKIDWSVLDWSGLVSL